MKNSLSPHDIEQISAYLDGELEDRERAALESRLRAERQLRQELRELGQIRASMRNLPKMRTPRNFTLTAEMAGKSGKRRFQLPRIVPSLQLSSALASLLLVLVLLGDFLNIGIQTAVLQSQPLTVQSDAAVEEVFGAQEMEAAPAEQPEPAESPPMLMAPPVEGTPAIEKSILTEQPVTAMAVPEGEENPQAEAVLPSPAMGETQLELSETERGVELEQTTPAQELKVAPQAEGESETPSEEQLRELQELPVAPPVQRTLYRTAEIILALIALGTALSAWFLRQRGSG